MSISPTKSMPDHQESTLDRISSLPDTILSHILSFFPTEDAFATSVLSSRWKFLWKRTSNLIFCYNYRRHDRVYIYNTDNNTGRFMEFLHFVNRTLLLHHSKCIDKFSLHNFPIDILYHYNTIELIVSWVSSVVDRNVKVIVIDGDKKIHPTTSQSLRFNLPACTYACKSLQVLHVRGVVILDPYGLVCLPNLHTLRLEDVFIASDESLKKLLSGCSSLKTLYALRGCSDRVATFNVTSPTLEHLTITTYNRIHTYDVNHKEEQCIKLELDVPALKYLYIHDGMVNYISMEDMPSLLGAEISLPFQSFENQIGFNWQGIHNLFRAISRVKLLTLDEFTLMALSRSGLSPKFPRLTNLTLKAGFCKWSALQDLLEGADSLEYLTLNIYFREHLHASCWVKPQKMPACFSCLKEMSIGGFSGSENELAMLGYILENASLLETMKITSSSHLNLSEKCQVLQKLSKIRTLSKKCEVIFPYELMDDPLCLAKISG